MLDESKSLSPHSRRRRECSEGIRVAAGEEILRKGLGARGRVEWRGEHMTVLLPRGVHEFDW